jgi:hypothetical protein
MPFKLRITFSGLCLFVPGKDDSAGWMHVLMPATGKRVHKHVAQLGYDQAYEVDATGDPVGMPKYVPIEGSALGGPSGTKPGANLPAPEGLVDLSDLTGAKVEPRLVEGPPDSGIVAARMSLGAGVGAGVPGGAYWNLDGREVRMPHRAVWILDVPGDNLTWSVAGTDGGLRSLRPIDGEIVLYVMHQPAHELPPTRLPLPDGPFSLPPRGYRNDHFEAYYDVLDQTPQSKRPIPVFERGPDAAPGPGGGSGASSGGGRTAPTASYAPRERGLWGPRSLAVGLQSVSTYTCVPSSGKLKP